MPNASRSDRAISGRSLKNGARCGQSSFRRDSCIDVVASKTVVLTCERSEPRRCGRSRVHVGSQGRSRSLLLDQSIAGYALGCVKTCTRQACPLVALPQGASCDVKDENASQRTKAASSMRPEDAASAEFRLLCECRHLNGMMHDHASIRRIGNSIMEVFAPTKL
jgi:hypothetical protein